MMANLCGSEIPTTTYNSTENKMLVVFKTDSSISYKGFSAKYKTVKMLTSKHLLYNNVTYVCVN